ncbi:MAG: histidine kinase N-terminal domain-containing protein [Eubacteriales bacterium]|nr:histidine kinase N-terminal domain-containing protein [Eubacteriales bacterium]
MANEIRECEELCRKYTALSDEEIEAIYPYLKNLQKFAENEQCNVYIDCMTVTGKSMIIVGEAYPEAKGTIYDKPLYGDIMFTENEPAVERTFNTGLATRNVSGSEVFSGKAMMQQVFPIKFMDKVVAVLIYEHLINDTEAEYFGNDRAGVKEVSLPAYIEKLLNGFDEALLLVNNQDKICYSNKYSDNLLKVAGYVGRVLGMGIENVIADVPDDKITFNMNGYSFEGRVVRLGMENVKYAVIMDDITEKMKREQKIKDLDLLIHEERHSAKDWLMFLSNYAMDRAESEDSQAYRDMADRIRMLQSINELKLRNGSELELKSTLEYTLSRISLDLTSKNVTVDISGDDIMVTTDVCNVVLTVIYELICNSLKHAFEGRNEGRIKIELKDDLISSTIVYSDDGRGFDADSPAEGYGLGIIRDMIKDRLGGEFEVSSGPKGTTETFDLIK